MTQFMKTWMIASPKFSNKLFQGQTKISGGKQWKNSLPENATWSLGDLPEGKKAVKCKWVYKLKGTNRETEYKARLVDKAFKV